MGFAESFLKAKALKLASQKQKQQEKLTNLQIQEAVLKLGAFSEQARAQDRVLNPPPPEFGNLSVSGALAAQEEQANPQGLIGGQDAPANASLSEIMARAQTGKVNDLVRSGLLDEFKKLQQFQGFRTQEESLANIQGSGILGGEQQGGEFIKRKTTLNPMTGSLSLQFEQARPIVRDLDENSLAVISPITGEMVGTIEKSSPGRRRTLQEQQFVPEKELENIVFIDPIKRKVIPAPFNLTRGQLNDKKFRRVGPAQKKQLAALTSALGMLEQLSGTVDSVFTAQAGLLERGIAGGQNTWEQILQNNPALTLYSSQSQGFVSRLARALGEVGTLTDQDAARALKLLPRIRNIFGLPDTADIAQAKMEAFTTLLQSQYNQILGGQVFDVKTPVFDKLIKDSPEDGLFQQGREAIGGAERSLAGEAKSTLDKAWESFKKRFDLQDSQ